MFESLWILLATITGVLSNPVRGLLHNIAAAWYLAVSWTRSRTSIVGGSETTGEVLVSHASGYHSLVEKARSAWSLWKARGMFDDLTLSITLYQQSLDRLRSPPDVDQDLEREVAMGLTSALITRYEHIGAITDLDQAFDIYKHVVESIVISEHVRGAARLDAARIICWRVKRLATHVDALGEAEKHCRDVLGASPDSGLRDLDAVAQLARVLVLRWEQLDVAPDLEEGLALAREAVAGSPPDACDARTVLAQSLVCRFEAQASVVDIDEAISILSSPPVSLRRTHPDGWGAAHTHGMALYRRGMHRGSVSDLEEAIIVHGEVLKWRGVAHPDYRRSLSALASTLESKFDLVADDAALDKALQYRKQALSLAESVDPASSDSARCCYGLATSFSRRYQRGNNLDDLDVSIDLLRRSVAILAPDSIFRFQSIQVLAMVLYLRFTETGDIFDLEEAITHLRQIHGSEKQSFMEKATCAVNLGALLNCRYKQSHKRHDLQESITVLRSVKVFLPATHPARIDALKNLGDSLLAQYEYSRDPGDIVDAISSLEEPLSKPGITTPDDLRTLADAYLARFRGEKNLADLDVAHKFAFEALSQLVIGHPRRALSLFQASKLHLQLKTSSYDPVLALRYFHEAVTDNHAAVQLRLREAAQALEALYALWLDDRSSIPVTHMLAAYASTISLLPRVSSLVLKPSLRLRSMAIGDGLAIGGARFALEAAYASRSVELLEQGRASFWNQGLQIRSSLDNLPPELAERLITLTSELERGGYEGGSGDDQTGEAMDRKIQRRRKQHEQLDILLKEIRILPGFGNFMGQDDYSTLSRVAEKGPVVILIAGTKSSEAVIIPAAGMSPIRVSAPAITQMWLHQSSMTWRNAAQEDRENPSQRADRLAIGRKRKFARFPLLTSEAVLRDLWEKVVKPVFEALSLQRSTGRARPRLWWLPTGPFAFLPIHAAGIYDDPKNNISCSDFVVSSYTPTLGSLLRARHGYQPIPRANAELLLTAVPHPDPEHGRSGLPMTVHEMKDIAGVVPEANLIRLPDDDSPLSGDVNTAGMSVSTLLQKLPDAHILHLACHGMQDKEDPLQSGFVLRDGLLTISRLMPLKPLPNAFLAYLSACETAKSDASQPDQAVHLAATMLFAGFRSVVATMWSMDDCDGPIVAKAMYERLFDGSSHFLDADTVPYALDQAVAILRDSGLSPSRWAPYIHLGM